MTSVRLTQKGALLQKVLAEHLGLSHSAVLELALRHLARREGVNIEDVDTAFANLLRSQHEASDKGGINPEIKAYQAAKELHLLQSARPVEPFTHPTIDDNPNEDRAESA